jgi:hypothetical protein
MDLIQQTASREAILLVAVKRQFYLRILFQIAGSLLDLREIGCKGVWLVYISPLLVRKGR